MTGYPIETAAHRAGVSVDQIARLTALGILKGDTGTGYSDDDVRRVLVVLALERAELPLDLVGELVRHGAFALEFIDTAGDHIFAPLSGQTFGQLAERTGVPIEILLVLRDAIGGLQASPDDLVQEDELRIVPLVALQHELGFRPVAIERALRVYGDSLRRIAEAEAEWWRSEIQDAMLAQGLSADDVGRRAGEISPRLSALSDEAVMAVYHAQQRNAWTTNIVNGIAIALDEAGLHERDQHPPAMCFLDLTGFTSLTQEHGDAAAAALVERLNRIVQRLAVEHGGRPVKWLGDGVMCHFPEPPGAVLAALAMAEAIPAAGLPPAHVGIHAGPVILQEGDYYGQTVNVASRIGDYARPGEVLVSRAVMEASQGTGVSFRPVGPVELKGLSGLIELFTAQRQG